ncbi:MAG: response regulator [Thermodesulfobacteriota bacterium]|nr:response regulator [Thermodesulfobacteriota bacterium]
MATILVIDDERDACTLIRRVLTALGHETHVFTDHDAALKWLEGNPVDLVLLDIKLQHVDGISVLETIRKRQPDIKVIMITGYPSVDTVKKALDLGIEDYLVKPIEIHELEERVSKALGLIL